MLTNQNEYLTFMHPFLQLVTVNSAKQMHIFLLIVGINVILKFRFHRAVTSNYKIVIRPIKRFCRGRQCHIKHLVFDKSSC